MGVTLLKKEEGRIPMIRGDFTILRNMKENEFMTTRTRKRQKRTMNDQGLRTKGNNRNMQKTKTRPQTVKSQSKVPVDREAVRMLAIELGAREAARRLSIKESTVLSWARRYNWKLPKRSGGGSNAITPQSKPGDTLIATHKELEETTKTALMQTLAKAAQAVAQKQPLDVSNMAQLRDACLSAARMFGWDGKPKTNVTVNTAVQTGVFLTEERRRELIAQRERILKAGVREPVREAEVIEDAERQPEKTEPAPQEPHREPEWVTNWKRAADAKTSQEHEEEVNDDGLPQLR